MSDRNVCNDFNLLQAAICDEKSYRAGVLKSLCQLITLQTQEDESIAPVTYVLPQVVKTASQVESGFSTYATVGLINTIKKLNYIRVINLTNVFLSFSYDGGANTAFSVPAGGSYTEELNLNLVSADSLQMIKDGTASTGSVYIEGRYLL